MQILRREVKIMDVRKGEKSILVKNVQEWLVLHDYGVMIDGDFGPATEEAVKRFQLGNNLKDTGVVNDKTFELLNAPLIRATRRDLPLTKTLGDMVVAVAENHLAEHPRECGGENSGPWCQYYLQGNSGSNYPWCAAFVCSIVKQACAIFGVKMPISETFSCDLLARNSTLVQCPNARLASGSIFILKKGQDYFHTGIVKLFNSDFYSTIEGNTNVAGAREGIECRERIRGYKNVDFIVI